MNYKLFLRDNKKAIDINASVPTNANELADFIEKKKIGTIVISTDFGDKKIVNVDFLKKIISKQNIKELYILTQIKNENAIYDFNNLNRLTLYNGSKNTVNLDLTLLPKLIELRLNGDFTVNGLENSCLQGLMLNKSNTFKITSKCEKLEKLEVLDSDSFSLDQIQFLLNLKELVLTQLNIKSLKGIEELKKLENIQINYCNKLIDISHIAFCLNLKKVELDACKKIENIESLSSLTQVQGLRIINCGSISSLKFIREMTSLKSLSFGNTNIIDGDLTECLRLDYVGTFDKKHYNIKVKDLPNKKNYTFWKS